jgi:hypothetical protein
MAGSFAFTNLGRELVDTKADFRNQNGVGIARNAGVQRDPTGLAAHHLHHHHALVALGGGVQAAYAFGGKASTALGLDQ